MSRSKIAIFFIIVLAAVVLFGAVKARAYQSEIRALSDELALKDETIEIKEGLFAKRTLEMRKLHALLDEKDSELSSLKKELKKRKQKLLAVTRTSVRWKNAYEATIKEGDGASQTEQPDGRTRVDFAKDFGYIGVLGHTLTNPAEAFVSVKQNRPLKLSIALAQRKDGSWQTYVTSSEENVGVDIELAGVDPHVIRQRWYERFGLYLGINGWDKLRGASLGAAYWLPIGSKLSLQSSVYVTNDLDPGVWASMLWSPFVRD